MPEKIIDTDAAITRRDILKSAAVGAGILAAIPVLVSRARADDPAPPTPPAKPDVWKDAGAADDFKANEPKRVDLGVVVAWVTRLDDKTFEGVSAKCTHRGCELGYDVSQSPNLVCPCHGGTFKLDGSNVYGTRRDPSNPLPNLTVLPVQVKDGHVQVNVGALS